MRRPLKAFILLVTSGMFDMDLPLSEVGEGYRAMDERRAVKVMLRVEA